MSPSLVHHELTALERRYPVRYEADQRAVHVDDVELPDGWTPRTVTVTLKLPSTYPQAAPRAVIPGTVRYHGRVPRRLLSSGRWLVRGQLGDPFIYWPPWDRHTSTLASVVDAMVNDLAAVHEPALTGADDDA